MTPPRPTSLEYFLARHQYPIVLSTFGLQVCHHQYIKRTQPVLELSSSLARPASLPRPLRAGLAWAVVFAGLLTKIALAQRAVVNFSDPVVLRPSPRESWARIRDESAC